MDDVGKGVDIVDVVAGAARHGVIVSAAIERVVAAATDELIHAGIAVQRVIIVAAVEQVRIVVAIERVIAGVAIEPVLARKPMQRISAGVAVDGVCQGVARACQGRADERQIFDDLLVGRVERPVDRSNDMVMPTIFAGADFVEPVLLHFVAGVVDMISVVALAADQHILTQPAIENVVAVIAGEHVIVVATIKLVIAAQANQAIARGAAGEMVIMAAALDHFDVGQGVALGVATRIDACRQVDRHP